MRNQSVRSWLSKERFGYHVSDALMCARQHVFKTMNPIPLTEREIELFNYGKSIHKSFADALYYYNPTRFKPEYGVEYMGITGHIDVMDLKKNIPIELKTTQQTWINEPKSFNIQQLKWYMALLNSTTGFLIYHLNIVENRWKKFKITMTQTEIHEQRHKLVNEMKSIKFALKSKDASLARAIWRDESLNWLCKNCPFINECKEIDPRD